MNSSLLKGVKQEKIKKNVTGDQVPQMGKTHNLVGPKQKQI